MDQQSVCAMTTEPTVILVNQISRRGHLDSYARLYSRCLLELGYRVALIAEHDPRTRGRLQDDGDKPDTGFIFFARAQLRAEIDRELAERKRRLKVDQELQTRSRRERELREEREHQLRLERQRQLKLERDRHQLRLGSAGVGAGEAAPPSRIEILVYELMTRFPILARARLVWRVEGVQGILDRIAIYLRRGLNLVVARPIKYCLNRLMERFPILSRARRVWSSEGPRGFSTRLRSYSVRFARKALAAVGVAVLPQFLDPVDAPAPGVDFGPIVDEICAAERLLGIKPVLVLFLYLDMMSESREGCRWLEGHLGTPWGGILFHPRVTDSMQSAAVERYFLCSNARGAVFLNPALVPVYRRILPKLFFEGVPDVTESAMLPGSFEMARELQARARGRSIVLQFGSLGPHKGIMDLLDVVRVADSRHYFFAIVGEIFWDSYAAEEAQKLRAFFSSPPENCYLHLGYLDDERQLNSLIHAADVLYSVYRGEFRDSSNTLTKAAVFEKPVVVSDQYLVGERVRKFRLGAAVESGDIKSILAGLESVRLRPKAEFGFAAFRQDHSIEALKSALSSALDSWMRPAARAVTNRLLWS